MSRPRSGRGASAGGNRPAAPRGVYVQAPKPDIYVALLGVSLGAMILGCILLAWVFKGYDFSTKVSAISAPPSAGVALTASANPPALATSLDA